MTGGRGKKEGRMGESVRGRGRPEEKRGVSLQVFREYFDGGWTRKFNLKKKKKTGWLR